MLSLLYGRGLYQTGRLLLGHITSVQCTVTVRHQVLHSVLYRTVHYGTLQNSAVPYSRTATYTAQYITGTVPQRTVQYSTQHSVCVRRNGILLGERKKEGEQRRAGQASPHETSHLILSHPIPSHRGSNR